MKIFDDISNAKVYRFGTIYIMIFTLIAAVVNYFTWGVHFTPPTISNLVTIFWISMWFALYAPIPIFIKKAKWGLQDFGFVINKRTIITSAAIALLIIIKLGARFPLDQMGNAMIEAYARVGEEVFFRGFIFTLVVKLFKGNGKSKFWAVVISSLFFAIMHTQTFLPTNPYTMQGMFLNTLLLGALRYYTGSILPGIIIHCVSNTGLIGLLTGTFLYCLFMLGDYIFIRYKNLRAKSIKEVTSKTEQ